jgi:hypothetical protein
VTGSQRREALTNSAASPTGFEQEPGRHEHTRAPDFKNLEHVNAPEEHGGPPPTPRVGQLSEAGGPAADPVEAALADAIAKAAAAGRYDVLPTLVSELEARRKARNAVVDLDAERARRDGKK